MRMDVRKARAGRMLGPAVPQSPVSIDTRRGALTQPRGANASRPHQGLLPRKCAFLLRHIMLLGADFGGSVFSRCNMLLGADFSLSTIV